MITIIRGKWYTYKDCCKLSKQLKEEGYNYSGKDLLQMEVNHATRTYGMTMLNVLDLKVVDLKII